MYYPTSFKLSYPWQHKVRWRGLQIFPFTRAKTQISSMCKPVEREKCVYVVWTHLSCLEKQWPNLSCNNNISTMLNWKTWKKSMSNSYIYNILLLVLDIGLLAWQNFFLQVLYIFKISVWKREVPRVNGFRISLSKRARKVQGESKLSWNLK